MLQNIYDQMWSDFRAAIAQNRPELDHNINCAQDTRRGITALAYLNANSSELTQEISAFQEQFRQKQPKQYYYPVEDMHLTILSIISCLKGFTLSDINIEKYQDVFNAVFAGQSSIEIEFRGITASPSCIVVQGFPLGNALEILRDKLRDGFTKSGLQCSFDSRYKLVTAHSTVIRFRRPIENSKLLLELCDKYRDHEFGKVNLTQYELVFNDWYQRQSNSKSLSQKCVDNRNSKN